MIKIILAITFIFAGIYLVASSVMTKKKGTLVDALFRGYQNENGAEYPLFHFTYNNEEFDMKASMPNKKHKYTVDETVKVYYTEGSESVVVAGENGELKNGIFLLAAGIAILVLMFLKSAGY